MDSNLSGYCSQIFQCVPPRDRLHLTDNLVSTFDRDPCAVKLIVEPRVEHQRKLLLVEFQPMLVQRRPPQAHAYIRADCNYEAPDADEIDPQNQTGDKQCRLSLRFCCRANCSICQIDSHERPGCDRQHPRDCAVVGRD